MSKLIALSTVAALFSTTGSIAQAHPASCAADRQPASIVQASTPDYPVIAQAAGLTGTSVIRIDLSETGSVVSAFVAHSSGSVVLDRAALRTARSMTYAPETQSCKTVPGSYAVEVEFAG
jgi:TonB family protein